MLADHMERLRYIALAEVGMTKFAHFSWLLVDDAHLFMGSLHLPSVQKMWKRPEHHMEPLAKLGLPSTHFHRISPTLVVVRSVLVYIIADNDILQIATMNGDDAQYDDFFQ